MRVSRTADRSVVWTPIISVKASPKETRAHSRGGLRPFCADEHMSALRNKTVTPLQANCNTVKVLFSITTKVLFSITTRVLFSIV